jgi:hypothetical protein
MTGLRRISALAFVVAAVAVTGCGGDEEGKGIPQATATALLSQLDNVQARINQGSAGACKDVLEGPRGPNKQQVQHLIDSMPDDVDSDVKSALQDSFDQLWDLVEQECEDRAAGEETNKPTPTQTQTETTPEETETETTPEETETETTPTAPENAPLPNDGNGEGNGGGTVPGTGNGGGVGPSSSKDETGKKAK